MIDIEQFKETLPDTSFTKYQVLNIIDFLFTKIDLVSKSKNIIIKPTAINLGKFYGVSRETIRNYRDGNIEKQRLYNAMVEYFVKENQK